MMASEPSRAVLIRLFGMTQNSRGAPSPAGSGQLNDWVIPVNLSNDFRSVLAALAQVEGPEIVLVNIRLLSMQMRLIVADAAWDPPGGVFDPNVLVQPGTLSNVEQGFGFIGSGYRLALRWRPPDNVVLASGFALPDTLVIDPARSW